MGTDRNNCDQVQGFSLGEKIFTQVLFNGMILLGVVGIWGLSPAWALIYLGYALGSFSLLMRYTICARCPHLKDAGDCLFVPPSLAKYLVGDRTGRLNMLEMIIFYAAFGGTMLGPLPFLIASPVILVLFLLAGAGVLLGLRTRICKKKCRVDVCPFHPDYAAK